MEERRRPGTRCPQCASPRLEMTVRGRSISYTCLRCAHPWADRRQAGRAQADVVLPHGETHRAVAAICAARDLDALMATTRRWVRRLTGADGVTIAWRTGDTCYYADEDAIAPLWKGERVPLDACVSGWVLRHRLSVVIPDIYNDPRVAHHMYRPTFVKSLLVVPVRKSDPVAALGAYWRTECAPTPGHVQLVELVAEAAAIVLATDHLWARVQDQIAVSRGAY